MRSRSLCWLNLPGALCALAACCALAQGRVPDAPLLQDVNPPSAQSGTTVDVSLSGQRLAGTRQILCRYSAFPGSRPPVERGVKAEVLSAGEGQVKARITVAADAPDGLHEIRALASQGITNPLYFYVSQHPQVPEKEPNNSPGEANPVPVPATLAGAIQQGEDRDLFSFEAKAGETLTFQVEGFKRFAPPQNNQQGIRYLDSFIQLLDAGGKELAYDDDSSRLDAFLAYTFPTAGKYLISIRDSLYRGQGDFHYRLTIGRQPVITAVLPPGGQRGKRYAATLFGYNLDSTGATSVK
ncbi:MAG TPA: PPC domain-containing protein, partial [Armatimonadota bacterium]|nr:PPC domain-containing protein [Armatimonadota bacterium]